MVRNYLINRPPPKIAHISRYILARSFPIYTFNTMSNGQFNTFTMSTVADCILPGIEKTRLSASQWTSRIVLRPAQIIFHHISTKVSILSTRLHYHIYTTGVYMFAPIFHTFNILKMDIYRVAGEIEENPLK